MILCSFKNLHLSFGPKQLFKNAELTIEESDRIGLLGLNGKGKSSLFKILEGLQAPDTSHPPFIFDQHQSFSLFHVPQELPSKISEQTSLQDCFWEFYPQFKELHLELNKINASLEAGKNNERDLIRQNEIFETLEQNQIWSLFSEFESYCKSFGLLTSAI